DNAGVSRKALERVATESAEGIQRLNKAIESLTAVVGDNAGVSRKALERVATESAQGIQRLNKAIESLRAVVGDNAGVSQKALDRVATESAEGIQALNEGIETLTKAVGHSSDLYGKALARLSTDGAKDIRALNKAIEALGGRQDKAYDGVIMALDAVALEMTELGRVRSVLLEEQRKGAAVQRRRIQDIARIQALSAERDALEIELQAVAARHRRAVRSASAGKQPLPPPVAPPLDITVAPSAETVGEASSAASLPVAATETSPTKADAAAMLAEARQAKADRDWPRAREAYAAYTAAHPRKASAWKQYGHALKESGDFDGAKAAYFRSLALSPSDEDTCLHLAHLLKNIGDRDLAAEVFGAALAMNPDFGPAKDGLGDLGFAIPESGPARLKARKTDTRLDRWFYRKRLRWAQSAFAEHKWDAAEARYRSLLRDRPWDARLMIQIGHALKEQGKIEAAAQMYQRALDQEPLNSDAHLHLGHAAKLAGDIQGAHDHYRRALRYWPQNPDALSELRDAS
ncbi:tetratricopeptide repeat protein, partial [Brevundimonas sp.]|uniref:tetratricopeptide repeat protein n=1 Tax=Brevundimonas sp. TaxID=1871086 RepID=UPI00289CDB06